MSIRQIVLRFMLLLLPLTFSVSILSAAQLDVVGPDRYPADVNPLTGLTVDDPDVLDRRPLIIKISNFPPVVRTYQLGLNEADVVWESLLAGGVTRFSAVILSADLDKVGPIRSGRLIDFELVRIYRALYTYSGMAQGTLDVLRGDDLMLTRVVGGSGPCPPLCRYEQDGLALEHTLFADTLGIRELAVEREADTTPEPIYGMAFGETTPEAGVPLDSVAINYSESQVMWDYDAESGRWLRWQDGDEHFDGNGVQVSAANVVIIEEEHTVQPFVSENYWGPGDFAFSVNFIGSGRIFFLRDGRFWEGEWRRETREDPLTYFDSAGNVLVFKPGNTFFNLVPRWIDGYQLLFITPDAPTVTVNGDTGASMRLGPSEAYRTPDVAYPGDTFAVRGRNWNGAWLQVQRTGEDPVWLPVNRLEVSDLDIMALPNPRPTNERG